MMFEHENVGEKNNKIKKIVVPGVPGPGVPSQVHYIIVFYNIILNFFKLKFYTNTLVPRNLIKSTFLWDVTGEII
jgi:hypothetical protein